jgi:alpha-L-fucosidase
MTVAAARGVMGCRRHCWSLLCAAVVAAAAVAAADVGDNAAPPRHYEPTWPSLMERPLPAWFDDEKIGVFLHWGVFSVPAWGPSTPTKPAIPSEWYWHSLRGGFSGCCGTEPVQRVVEFHNRTYGPKFDYTQFAPMFSAELFEPSDWAALFKRAGIRYVVLTAKHHEVSAKLPATMLTRW